MKKAIATQAAPAAIGPYSQAIEDFAAMNEVYAEFFEAPYPARAAFQVAALPKNAKVEISVTAVRA